MLSFQNFVQVDGMYGLNVHATEKIIEILNTEGIVCPKCYRNSITGDGSKSFCTVCDFVEAD